MHGRRRELITAGHRESVGLDAGEYRCALFNVALDAARRANLGKQLKRHARGKAVKLFNVSSEPKITDALRRIDAEPMPTDYRTSAWAKARWQPGNGCRYGLGSYAAMRG